MILNNMSPKIICHIMASVDGRLLTDRWTLPFDGKSESELLGIYGVIGRKLNTDAWMFGKNTLTEGFFPKKFHADVEEKVSQQKSYVAPRSSKRLFIVADPDADILYDASDVRGDDIVTILPENVPAAYLEHLRQRGISYLFAGNDGCDLPLAMHTLSETFGVKTVSLQGGGIIDGAFLQAGLIDELSLVVYPGIDGSASSPSVFEYTGDEPFPARGQSLELLSVETMLNGVVWLRYKFHREKMR